MATYISFDHVSKRFGQEIVLQDVSFQLDAGKIYGILGRNGSGKTVIFKLLAGLLRPDGGKILLQGENISQGGRFLSSAGILIESPGFIPHYSGLKNLKALNDLSPHPVPLLQLEEAMTTVGLNPNSKKPVRTYSLGMKQKLGIAQALMHRPSLLILDEPMNALDEASVAHVRQLLMDCRSGGTTVFLASHDPQDIEALCDEIFTIHNGSVALQSQKQVAL